MGRLTPEQIRQLRDYLEEQGLTFELLQTEMLDHLCSDIESHIETGLTFNEAMEKVKSDIPKQQLKKLQTETMEAINRKIKPTGFLAYITLILLVAATIFKLMHLPGAGWILISAFIGIGLTMVSAFFSTPLIKEKEQGKTILVAFSLTIMIFIISLCFQILHFPGTALLRHTSVIACILLLSGYAVYSYLNPQKVTHHLLPAYIKKEASNIEKSLIILLIFGVGLKFWQNNLLFVVFLMLVFSIGSAFYFIRSWQYYTDKEARPEDRFGLLLITILSYAMFMIPSMRSIGTPVRIIMTWSSYVVMLSGLSVYYFRSSKDSSRLLLGFSSLLIAGMVLLNLMAKTHLLPPGLSNYLLDLLYHPVSFAGLIILFIIYFKRMAFRALLLLTLSMWFFSWQLPGI